MDRSSKVKKLALSMVIVSALSSCGQNAHVTRPDTAGAPAGSSALPSGGNRNGAVRPDVIPPLQSLSKDAAKTDCPNGGKVQVQYEDANNNRQYDTGEIVRETTIICNGKDGTAGKDAVSQLTTFRDATEAECDGATGLIFTSYEDTDHNGTYTDKIDKVLDTKKVCTLQGKKGDDGLRGLPGVSIGFLADSAPKEDCPAGGDTFTLFRDVNGDNQLNPKEGDVELRKYKACNPERRARPKTTKTEASPEECREGGQVLTFTWEPIDGRGALDDTWPTPQSFKVCNGERGKNGISLAPGADRNPPDDVCKTGSVVIYAFTDTDGDGVMSAEEKATAKVATKICNGEKGDKGDAAPYIAMSVERPKSGATDPALKECASGSGTVIRTFISKARKNELAEGDEILSTQAVCDGAEAPLFPVRGTDVRPANRGKGECPDAGGFIVQTFFHQPVRGETWDGKFGEKDQAIGDAAPHCLNMKDLPPLVISNIRDLDGTTCPSGKGQELIVFRDVARTGLYDAAQDGDVIQRDTVCRPKDGKDGKDGVDGKNGTSSATVISTLAAGDRACPNGGTVLNVYGNLAPGQEVSDKTPATQTRTFCNNSLTWQLKLPDGEKCKGQDGVDLITYVDADGSGTYSEGEAILNHTYLCSGKAGKDGVDGKNGTSSRIVFVEDTAREVCGAGGTLEYLYDNVPYGAEITPNMPRKLVRQACNTQLISSGDLSDPSKCDGRGGRELIAYLDTDHSGTFTKGDEVLRREPLCNGEKGGKGDKGDSGDNGKTTGIRWRNATKAECKFGGLFTETFIGPSPTGEFMEGKSTITSFGPICFDKDLIPQPPRPVTELSCSDTPVHSYGRIVALTPAELDQIKDRLPYKLSFETKAYKGHPKSTVQLGLVTDGVFTGETSDGLRYVQNTLVAYKVQFDLPAADRITDKTGVRIEADFDLNKYLGDTNGFLDTELFCLLDERVCSGRRYRDGNFKNAINDRFWGNRQPENTVFADKMHGIRAQMTNPPKVKAIPGFTTNFAQLFTATGSAAPRDQFALLYDRAERHGSGAQATFTVITADDTFATKLKFRADLTIQTCHQTPVATQ